MKSQSKRLQGLESLSDRFSYILSTNKLSIRTISYEMKVTYPTLYKLINRNWGPNGFNLVTRLRMESWINQAERNLHVRMSDEKKY